ncbi:CAP domain-containing protein [Paenibacillus thiaminolyticus]|uniref:CAP domain-containing protein n=1 Tax=Paenibacillus thiaminolyticus TaxID=49283 RepID=UPI00232D7409|nr:CAP domain-containing protein [Paenibacillus thiaminolyticus]WCF10609.1 CAP domain-containing protein [Paenibacillus thiaminolyticus]
MVRFFVLTVLLLVTGCSAQNNTMQKQAAPEQTRISPHAHTGAPNSVLTQASSTATSWTERSSITTKEAQNGMPLDLLDLIQTPAGNPANQAPTGNPETNNPTGSTGQAREGLNDTKNNNSSQFEQQVLDLVNQERSKTGLSSLSMSEELSNMAMVKAQDMYNNNYFDHNSPTHGSPFDMMKEFGITYNSAGENIAKGQTTPTQVMNDWMNSPGHKANILNNSYTHIGIAYYNNTWVQEFKG